MRLLFGNFVGRIGIEEETWFQFASDYGRHMLFEDGITHIANSNNNSTLEREAVCPSDMGYATLAIITWTAENLVEMFVENLCVANTLTMWMATNLFINCINQNCHVEWKNIYDRYRLLCKLSQVMNNGFAMWMGIYLVYSTSYLIAGIDAAVYIKMSGFYATSLLSQLVIFVILILAAKTCGQMNEMKIWLMNNHELIPERDYNAVTNELQWNIIGIWGGRNMPPITYSVLWSVSVGHYFQIF